MKIFKDNIPAPVGITAEEWKERKRKLKRKALIRMVLFFLFTVVLNEHRTWISGGYETLQPKHLEELQVKSGLFYYGGRMGRTGLTDPATGDVIVTFKEWFLSTSDIDRIRKHSATIWYYVGQGEIKYAYQLKVDDRLEFDLETVNQSLANVNKRNKELDMYMRISWNLFFLIFSLFNYNQQYQKWLLKEK